MSAPEIHDSLRRGAKLSTIAGGVLLEGDIRGPLVILVHGFTANGSYFKTMADAIMRSGYTAAYFDYNSFNGIDVAAAELGARLGAYSHLLRKDGIVLVGHSMGGLVARACVATCLIPSVAHVKGVVLLGTPNEGTLNNGWMLARLLDAGDRLAGFSAFYRLPMCRAAKQLVKSDPDDFILNLNAAAREKAPSYPTLSISGGLQELEIGSGRNAVFHKVCNLMIQRALGHQPNDGLVEETSADLREVLGKADSRRHDNTYQDHPRTNHSGLPFNQLVINAVLGFLRFATSRR